jgi:peptidyl-tRNA hydrolase
VDHVLSTFEAEERALVTKALSAAADLAEKIVTTGGSTPVTVTLDAGP